jgi:hypothetical protein
MESDEEYDYQKLLRRPEWRKKRAEILAKSPRCAKCGRKGGRLAVHHPEYEYGRLPWDYPDEAYMVVCSGRCHRDADADREEAEQDAENHERYGWQWELGKKEQRPRERELQKLAKYETEFKAWLEQTRLPADWDWNNQMYPLWWFWNQFSDKFLAERKDNDPQGRLAL